MKEQARPLRLRRRFIGLCVAAWTAGVAPGVTAGAATDATAQRDLYGVRLPSSVRVVVIEARDQTNGWGGKRIEVALPGR